MKLRSMLAVTIIATLLLLAACNLPQPAPQELSQQDVINTSAARTVAALSTALATGQNPTLGMPTAMAVTPSPSGEAGDPGDSGNNTPVSSETPSESAGGATVDPDAPCNRAEFIDDVTIPDGSVLPPNSQFTKTWELRNNGTCTWDNTYALVFAGAGDAMSGPAATPILPSGELKPGETLKISAPLRSPGEKGNYRGSWQLRAGDGTTFGIGPGAAGTFFVEINVDDLFSFAEHYCLAAWSTGSGSLPCPGKVSDSQGSVVQVENPRLESGTEGEGLGIMVFAQPVASGYTVGRFPAIMVPQQSDFRAQLGCRDGATSCFVRFKLTAQVDNGPEQILGEWNEGLDGNLTQAVVDLDEFSGRSTAFNLYVYVNGTPEASQAVWFMPRVVK